MLHASGGGAGTGLPAVLQGAAPLSLWHPLSEANAQRNGLGDCEGCEVTAPRSVAAMATGRLQVLRGREEAGAAAGGGTGVFAGAPPGAPKCSQTRLAAH